MSAKVHQAAAPSPEAQPVAVAVRHTSTPEATFLNSYLCLMYGLDINRVCKPLTMDKRTKTTRIVMWVYRILIFIYIFPFWYGWLLELFWSPGTLLMTNSKGGNAGELNTSGRLSFTAQVVYSTSMLALSGFMVYWTDHYLEEFTARFRHFYAGKFRFKFRVYFWSIFLVTIAVGLMYGTLVVWALHGITVKDEDYYNTIEGTNNTDCCLILREEIAYTRYTTDFHVGARLWEAILYSGIPWYCSNNLLHSAIWSLELLLFRWKYETYLKQITWRQINTGEVRDFYLRTVDRMSEISRKWQFRSCAAFAQQLVSLTIGTLTFINEWDTCKTFGYGGFKMLECPAFTGHGHVQTIVTAMNLFFDFFYAGYLGDNLARNFARRLRDFGMQDRWKNRYNNFHIGGRNARTRGDAGTRHDLEDPLGDAGTRHDLEDPLDQPNEDNLQSLNQCINTERANIGIYIACVRLTSTTMATVMIQLVALIILFNNLNSLETAAVNQAIVAGSNVTAGTGT